MQVGRKKMALDHVIIQQVSHDKLEDHVITAFLEHGAAELFVDDVPDHHVRYEDTTLEKLLDRSNFESTEGVPYNGSANLGVLFPPVWRGQSGTLQGNLPFMEETAPMPRRWAEIMSACQAEADAEAADRTQALGRGKRTQKVSNMILVYCTH